MPRGRKQVSIAREVALVRRSLRTLEKALMRLAKAQAKAIRNGTPGVAVKPRRKLKLSPARVKALQLHGQYLGYMRQLKPRQRAQVRAIRERKGVRAAIKRARKLAT